MVFLTEIIEKEKGDGTNENSETPTVDSLKKDAKSQLATSVNKFKPNIPNIKGLKLG